MTGYTFKMYSRFYFTKHLAGYHQIPLDKDRDVIKIGS